LFKNFPHSFAYTTFAPDFRTVMLTNRPPNHSPGTPAAKSSRPDRTQLLTSPIETSQSAFYVLTTGPNLTGLRGQKPLKPAPEIKNISEYLYTEEHQIQNYRTKPIIVNINSR